VLWTQSPPSFWRDLFDLVLMTIWEAEATMLLHLSGGESLPSHTAQIHGPGS
jgi:hypothetical protein